MSKKVNLEVVVPSGLNDIKLRQYVKFIKASEGIEDEAVLNELILTIFCNIKLEHLPLFGYNQIRDILAKTDIALKGISDNIPLIHRFTLKGLEYGFIPNLSNITYGENKAITTYLNEGVDGLHKAMAVLFRPITAKHKDMYQIEEYPLSMREPSPKWEEEFLDMPIDVMLSAQVFFWTLTKDLLRHIPSYLEKEIGPQQMKELMQNLSTNQIGEAMMRSFASLREI